MITTRLEGRELTGWGLRNRAKAQVAVPRSGDEIAALFAEVLAHRQTVGLRGGGNSYGDAALNDQQVMLSTEVLNRILAWDPATGVATVEPGVTIAQLWRRTLPDGWWPMVVPGTGAVTVGGAAATNVHGKNNWRAGSFGDFLREFELLPPSGQRIVCSREKHADLFHTAVGGLGLLG